MPPFKNREEYEKWKAERQKQTAQAPSPGQPPQQTNPLTPGPLPPGKAPRHTGTKTILIIAAAILCLIFLVKVFSGHRPQAEAPSWVNPTDQALLDAATVGFQGKDPDPVWLFSSEYPTRLKCAEKVSGVALYTPLWSAQLLGYNRRKEFGAAPALADFTAGRLRHSASIAVYYGSSRPDDEASLAVSVGGKLYRPTRIESLKTDAVSCDSEITPTAWSLAVDGRFEGPDALPTSGRGNVIVRRSSREDQQFDIDFDSIPLEAVNKEP